MTETFIKSLPKTDERSKKEIVKLLNTISNNDNKNIGFD